MDIFNLHKFKKRIFFVIIAFIIILSLIFVRLFYVQIISSGKLQARASEQWTRDLPLVAERGKILDRNGSALALSYASYNIYVRGREIKDAEVVAKLLSNKLDLDYAQVLDKVSNKNISEVLIKMQVKRTWQRRYITMATLEFIFLKAFQDIILMAIYSPNF